MTRPDSDFIEEARSLERAYLQSDDPMVQSGFGGGRRRWVAERSPLVNGINGDGDFLDVGCANGLLAADVVEWAAQRGYVIVPHGIDLGQRLIDLARNRLAGHADHFVAANAWEWEPHRQWRFVYSLLDLAPDDMWCQWMERLVTWVAPGGRLILGSYGSGSRGTEPIDVAQAVSDCGWEVVGEAVGGDPPVTRFAWTEK